MAIKIGNIDVSYFKVGSGDCSIYLGDTLLYPTTPPTPSYKFQSTYSGGQTYSEECDSNTTLSSGNTKPTGYTTSGMTDAVIGDCITSIDRSAFELCLSLSSVTIGSGVTSIGMGAFMNCTSLSSITIPSGVTSIGNWAFAYSSNLASVTVNATTPPELGSGVFQSTNKNLIIYVPSASLDTFKAASGWSTYASKIQAIQ